MYCKVCGKKLNGTEKFCSDCGSQIDYSEALDAGAPVKGDEGFRLSRSAFRMGDMGWDLEGYPIEEKKTDRVDFDWASVLEGKEKKAAEDRRRAIAMTEEDIYERIQSDRHNNEFDWNLVHTMRLDRAGRSELSLFHEDDEELFSADFIPPLNTADSYANMAQPEKTPTPASKSTVVIDKIDKSGIEEAATQAAGIQERDYAALGIDVNSADVVKDNSARSAKKKIEKFYTFNRKNEEFQALLDEEYERIRQKVQAQAEQDEMKDAVLEGEAVAEMESVDVAEVLDEVPQLTRGEVAKASAEAEADEAERLAAEAERLAEEAAAKAKAAEEAAAKAAAEALAAEEALRAMEEEELRAAEEAARIAAEEEAVRIAAEEEAARVAEEEAARAEEVAAKAEEAARKATEDAKIAEQLAVQAEEEAQEIITAHAEETLAADELSVKTGIASEVERLAMEEAAIDAELEKLTASHRALEAEAAKIEAGIYRDEDVEQAQEIEETDDKLKYGDIFDDEDDDEDDKRGGCKSLFLDILIVILALAVAAACMLIFLPDHPVSKKIRPYVPFLNSGTVEPEPQEVPVEPQEETPEPEEQPAPEPAVSATTAAITKAMTGITNIGGASEDTALIFSSGTNYAIEGVDLASVFTNAPWYTDGSGAEVTYVDAAVGTVLEYYSKLMDKLNSGDDGVMELVEENSQLYGELSIISANQDVTYEIKDIKIGEIRSNESNFYVLATVSESMSNAAEPEVATKLIHLQVNDESKTVKVVNIVDVQ